MKKSFLLIAILAAVLIFPFAINVDKAGADAIMFPWIVKSDTVSTLVTVVNTAQGNPDFPERVHLQYWVKDEEGPTADRAPDFTNDRENTCKEVDFKVEVSKDDVFTWDTSGKIGDGLPLYNDANTVPVSALSLEMNVDGPRRAFLLVDNNLADNFADIGSNEDGTLYGEAIVLELGSGAAWGYIAYNPFDGQTSDQSAPVDFEDDDEVAGEVLGGNEHTVTTLMPINVMTTRFFVTPVNEDEIADLGGQDNQDPDITEETTSNARVGDANTRIQLCLDPTNTVDNALPGSGTTERVSCEGGVYDNEEGPLSSSANPNVVCTGTVDLPTLLGAGFATYRDTGSSGWAYLVTNRGNIDQTGDLNTLDNPSDSAIVGRLDYTETSLVIAGQTIPGAFNNFVWFKNDDEGGGNDNIHNCAYTPSSGVLCRGITNGG